MTGRDVWAAWAATVRHPSDCAEPPGLTDLKAAVRDLPDAELEAGLRRGLLWARMGLGECVIWASDLPYNGNALAHELMTRQWSTVLGACDLALAVVRRPGRPGPLRDHVRLPDRLPAPVSYGDWTDDPHQPRCPRCGVPARWSAAHTGLRGPMPVRVNCMDGERVARRFPGVGPACPWPGANGQRFDDGRIVLDPPRRVPDTIPPEAAPFDLDTEVLP